QLALQAEKLAAWKPVLLQPVGVHKPCGVVARGSLDSRQETCFCRHYDLQAARILGTPISCILKGTVNPPETAPRSSLPTQRAPQWERGNAVTVRGHRKSSCPTGGRHRRSPCRPRTCPRSRLGTNRVARAGPPA